jgi:hypothetical protein
VTLSRNLLKIHDNMLNMSMWFDGMMSILEYTETHLMLVLFYQWLI